MKHKPRRGKRKESWEAGRNAEEVQKNLRGRCASARAHRMSTRYIYPKKGDGHTCNGPLRLWLKPRVYVNRYGCWFGQDMMKVVLVSDDATEGEEEWKWRDKAARKEGSKEGRRW